MKKITAWLLLALPLLATSTWSQTAPIRYVGGPSASGSEQDIGAQINAAYASLPSGGGTIVVIADPSGGCYQFSTSIVANIPGKYLLIEGGHVGEQASRGAHALACLDYMPVAGAGVTLDFVSAGSGNSLNLSYGISDLALVNNGCQMPGGCGSNAIGLLVGGTFGGAQGATFSGLRVTGFGSGVVVNKSEVHASALAFQNCAISDNAVGFSDNDGDGAQVSFDACHFEGNATGVSTKASLRISNSWIESNTLLGVSCSAPASCDLNDNHFENANTDTTHFLDGNGIFFVSGGDMRDDRTMGNTDWWMHFAGASFFILGTVVSSEGRTASAVVANEGAGIAVLQNNTASVLLNLYSNPSAVGAAGGTAQQATAITNASGFQSSPGNATVPTAILTSGNLALSGGASSGGGAIPAGVTQSASPLGAVSSTLSSTCGSGDASCVVEVKSNTAFTGINTVSNLNGSVYLDGIKYTLQPDIGVGLNAAIQSLPTIKGYKTGTIYLPSGQFTQKTTVTIDSPGVSIVGAGRQSTQITCTMNADCWEIRTTRVPTIAPGQKISGFSLIGPGAGYDRAVGIHTGDLIGAHFYDLDIANFIGRNSSCFWVDNLRLWFERNYIHQLVLGETPDGMQPGCTKHIRLTNGSGVPSQMSAGYNNWIAVHVSGAGRQIVISNEGLSIYGNFMDIKGNISPQDTIIWIPSSNPQVSSHNLFSINFECTGCTGGASSATGISLGPGTVLAYAGDMSELGSITDSLASTATLEHDIVETNGYSSSSIAASVLRNGNSGGYFAFTNNAGSVPPPIGVGGLLGAYNFSNGGGEYDFFVNKLNGSTGGYRFYDWDGKAATLRAALNDAGLSINGGAALPTSTQSGSGEICMTTSCGLHTPKLTNPTVTNGTFSDAALAAPSITDPNVSQGTFDKPALSRPSIGGGPAINQILLASQMLQFEPIRPFSCSGLLVAVPQASLAGVANANPGYGLGNENLSWHARIPSPNEVAVWVCNVTDRPIAPTPGVWRISVIQ